MTKHTSTAESLLHTKTQGTTKKHGGRNPYYPLSNLHQIFLTCFSLNVKGP